MELKQTEQHSTKISVQTIDPTEALQWMQFFISVSIFHMQDCNTI